MESMIERVAIALSLADPDERGLPAGTDMASFYRGLAVAAFQAMKVPTVDMLVTATQDWLCIRAYEDRAEVIWDAMIDTVLREDAALSRPGGA